jgi:hypothetical protein
MKPVAHLHHALFTGSILAAVSRLGTPATAELTTQVFSRQREMRFLPGLRLRSPVRPGRSPDAGQTSPCQRRA